MHYQCFAFTEETVLMVFRTINRPVGIDRTSWTSPELPSPIVWRVLYFSHLMSCKSWSVCIFCWYLYTKKCIELVCINYVNYFTHTSDIQLNNPPFPSTTSPISPIFGDGQFPFFCFVPLEGSVRTSVPSGYIPSGYGREISPQFGRNFDRKSPWSNTARTRKLVQIRGALLHKNCKTKRFVPPGSFLKAVLLCSLDYMVRWLPAPISSNHYVHID